jgi:hypothetical protein
VGQGLHHAFHDTAAGTFVQRTPDNAANAAHSYRPPPPIREIIGIFLSP